jgi:hypothetical protein
MILQFISDQVEDYYKLERGSIQIKSRKREIVLARQMAMVMAKKLTKYPLRTIGLEYGKKDHATVLHAVKTVNNLRDTDKKIRGEYEDLYKIVKAETSFTEISKEEIRECIIIALVMLLKKKSEQLKHKSEQLWKISSALQQK